MFNPLDRIEELRNARNMSIYRLAKDSGIPQSTLATWYSRGINPPIDKIESMCNAFGISLPAFFSTQDNLPQEYLTGDQKLLLEKYSALNASQQKAVMSIIYAFLDTKDSDL